jgi:copper chaperone CopZ
MRTVHCVRAVATSLGGVAGITGAQVRLGEAELEHDAPLDRSSIERAIELAGYRVDEIVTVRPLPLHGGQ